MAHVFGFNKHNLDMFISSNYLNIPKFDMYSNLKYFPNKKLIYRIKDYEVWSVSKKNV